MNEKKSKKQRTTLQERNRLRRIKYSMKTMSYSLPLVPVFTMVGINWNEWFITAQDGLRVASGFLFLVISTLFTYLSIAKKKKILEKASAFWNVSIIIICWGITLLFLSNILNDLGMMLLYIGFGIIASACLDEVETRSVESKYQFYQKLVTDNGLDAKENKKKAKLDKAKKQAEREAKIEREKVDYL